ncbi:MAG TPA: STAS domain-containing protein [Solirubrobacteraceae bacterium]|jgi:anti-anti-sigma factor|nr:STAS domain-containing protein [Solirubrobacteraceae bacterium]
MLRASGGPPAAGPTGQELPGTEFWLDEQSDDGGRIRLGLVGELDVAGAEHLRERLGALAGRDAPVLLDLRRLQFIDSSGLGELVRAVTDARRDSRTLEIDATLTPQVRQIIELLELQHILWPTA